MIQTQRIRHRKHTGFTLIELAVVIAIVVILTLVLLPSAPWNKSARLASCQGNLKQMGKIFSLYASEAPGNRYPPKSPYCEAPDVAVLYPDLMNDFEPLLCPESDDPGLLKKGNPDGWYQEDGTPQMNRLRREADASYTYFGFAVPNNAWVDPPESVRPLSESAFQARDDDADWTGHPNPDVGDVTLYRLRSGAELILADEGHIHADANGPSRLAITWDNVSSLDQSDSTLSGSSLEVLVFTHAPGGSNVLFLDGHVEFVEYGPGRFPVTREFATLSHGGFRSGIPDDMP